MPYIQRDENGVIVGIYEQLQDGYAEEWGGADDADVVYFIGFSGNSDQILGPTSAATLSILAGEVTGIETSVNFGAAFMIDLDTYWVFFNTPEPDTNYLVLGNVPFVRYTDYIEIIAADLTEVSLTTWRVK